MTRLVLWDIDHTLIATRGVGRELFGQAFKAVTGRVMERQARVDGMTDPVIFRETARLHGLEVDRKLFEEFAAALTAGHRERENELRERGRALPGAAAALTTLAAVPGVRQSVVTGNIRPTAEIKLRAFDLHHFINWRLGAYGEDHDVRTDLVRLALHRATTAPGTPPALQEVVVIGDTPADVHAAQQAGVHVIAVATGRSTPTELRAAGAPTVLPDLNDTTGLLKLIHHLGEA